MHFHPDMTHDVARRRYADLLEEARKERLAALASSQPEIRERMVSVRGVVSGIRLRLVHRPAPSRPGLSPS